VPLCAERASPATEERSGLPLLVRLHARQVLLGQQRIIGGPQNAKRSGDTFLVVASNAGAARPPAWYFNLCADPYAQIDVGGRIVDVRAQEAAGQERAEFWQRLTAANRYLSAPRAGLDATCRS
jgi:deazaflavin-dependent oxidoreductase (nitroreductase family)